MSWKLEKSTPLIFAFHPVGNGIEGYELAIFWANIKEAELEGSSPVTKSTPVGLIFIGLKVSNHLQEKINYFINILLKRIQNVYVSDTFKMSVWRLFLSFSNGHFNYSKNI